MITKDYFEEEELSMVTGNKAPEQLEMDEEEYKWDVSDSKIVVTAEESVVRLKEYWDDIYDEMEEDWDVYNLKQWKESQKVARAGRPMVTDDMTKPYIKQVVASVYENPTSFKLVANVESASSKAKALSGVLRHYENASGFAIARAWAQECAAVAGLGWLKAGYTISDSEEGGRSTLQLDYVSDPLSIMIDEKSRELTGSDARYIVEYISGEDHYVYWFKDKKGAIVWAEIKEGEVVDKDLFPSNSFPIVPVYGEQSVIRGEASHYGLIRALRDKQRIRNTIQSDLIERLASTPLPLLLIDEDSLNAENEQALRESAFKPVGAVTYSSVTDEGRTIKEPYRLDTAPNLSYASQALKDNKDGADASTGIYTSQNQNMNQPESGIAIFNKGKNQDRGQLVYSAHLKIADKVIGRVYLDLIQVIVESDGVVPIEDEMGNKSEMLVGYQDPTRPMLDSMGRPLPSIPDLDANDSDISITLQSAFSTRKEQGVSQVIELIGKSKTAEQYDKILPQIIEDLDIPNAERYVALLKGTDPDADKNAQAQQMQAQMQQMQQQLAAATSQLGQMQQAQSQMQQENLRLSTELKSGNQAKVILNNQNNAAEQQRLIIKLNSDQQKFYDELAMKDRWHNDDTTVDYEQERNKAAMQTQKLSAEADATNKKMLADAIKDIDTSVAPLDLTGMTAEL